MQSNEKNSPIALLILCIAIISFQSGSAFATHVFEQIGPFATAALRQTVSALILLAFARIWTINWSKLDYASLIPYGLALGFMNLFFYLSIAKIPLGVAVSIEFSGPLIVSVVSSRKPIDFLWIFLAGLGIVLLLPLNQFAQKLDPIGLIYALIAAAGWAFYIVFGHRIGKTLNEVQSVGLGMAICTFITIPLAVFWGPHIAISWHQLAYYGIILTMLSGAVPYMMEMFAMRRMRRQTVSLLMSLDPAFAVLSGFVFLHQKLDMVQMIAVALIICASIGATLIKPKEPVLDEPII